MKMFLKSKQLIVSNRQDCETEQHLNRKYFRKKSIEIF